MAILSKFASPKRVPMKPFAYSEDVKVVPKDVEWVIVLPSVRNIPEWMFAKCISLKRLDILDGLEMIGRNAFYGCTSLKLVRLPKTTRVISAGAFCQCSAMICIVFNEGLVEIGNHSFSECLSLKLFVLSSTVRILGESVCLGCTSLEAVALNEGLDWVQPFGFRACDNLMVIGIPKSLKRLEKLAIPESARQECKKPDDLWATLREKVVRQGHSIHGEFTKGFQIAPATKNGKQMIKAQAKNPTTKESPTLMRTDSKLAPDDSNRDVAGLGSLRSLLFPNDKGKVKEPRKANTKEVYGQKMIEATTKSLPLGGSGVVVGLNETNELKNALSFLRTKDNNEKQMKKRILEKFNSERKSKESPSYKAVSRLPAVPEPQQTAEAAEVKAPDAGETNARLSVFQNQIIHLRKEIDSGLRDLENRLKNVEDNAESRYSEARVQFRNIDQEHNHWKDHIDKQSQMISNAASAYERLTCDIQDISGRMDSCTTKSIRAIDKQIEAQQKESKAQLQLAKKEQCDLKTLVLKQAEMVAQAKEDSQKLVAHVEKLDGRLTYLDKKTKAIAEKQKESDREQQLARKEYTESQAGVSKKMRTMDAVLKKIGNDTDQLESRMSSVQNIATEKQAMKIKVDGLTADVVTLSQKVVDQVLRSKEIFEVMATDLENQERCLEVLKRFVEVQLEKERECIKEALLVPDGLPAGKKRPHDESDDESQSMGSIAGGFLRWTQSLLPSKKFKGGDEKESEN